MCLSSVNLDLDNKFNIFVPIVHMGDKFLYTFSAMLPIIDISEIILVFSWNKTVFFPQMIISQKFEEIVPLWQEKVLLAHNSTFKLSPLLGSDQQETL